MSENLKTFLNWSSGKDASLALHYLQNNSKFSVEHLLTSVNDHYDRISMHGVRRSMLEVQIKSIGLPFSTIELPLEPTMEEYEEKMRQILERLVEDGFKVSAFGDIFLEDLRTFREEKLKEVNLKGEFPLWKKNTSELAIELIEKGFKTIVVCAKSDLLDKSFVGRIFDKEFLEDLPDNVDPCGENGEFHTFCFDGPIFKFPVAYEIGEKTFKSYSNPNKEDQSGDIGFWFCDLLPKPN
ncbi:MAG: diphthine--ammonia ligase [Crocinitomicaceae bacterium]|nr:diphthine--ammonia ligase [Crocinitomicaceae bacterium]